MATPMHMTLLTTNSSNNYGPQLPGKTITLVLLNALVGNPRPIYVGGE
jgi:dTDP-D-glucose 4,6-dehydratase